jgi:hypothetical protein
MVTRHVGNAVFRQRRPSWRVTARFSALILTAAAYFGAAEAFPVITRTDTTRDIPTHHRPVPIEVLRNVPAEQVDDPAVRLAVVRAAEYTRKWLALELREPQVLAAINTEGDDVAIAKWSGPPSVWLWDHPARRTFIVEMPKQAVEDLDRIRLLLSRILVQPYDGSRRSTLPKSPGPPPPVREAFCGFSDIRLEIWSAPLQDNRRGRGSFRFACAMPPAVRQRPDYRPSNEQGIEVYETSDAAFLAFHVGEGDEIAERYPPLSERVPAWSTNRLVDELGRRPRPDRNPRNRDVVILDELFRRHLPEPQIWRLLNIRPHDDSRAGRYFRHGLFFDIAQRLGESGLAKKNESMARRWLARARQRSSSSFAASMHGRVPNLNDMQSAATARADLMIGGVLGGLLTYSDLDLTDETIRVLEARALASSSYGFQTQAWIYADERASTRQQLERLHRIQPLITDEMVRRDALAKIVKRVAPAGLVEARAEFMPDVGCSNVAAEASRDDRMVEISIVVDEGGTPGKPDVVSGDWRATGPARDAVMRSKWQPARLNNSPIPSILSVRLPACTAIAH